MRTQVGRLFVAGFGEMDFVARPRGGVLDAVAGLNVMGCVKHLRRW